MSKNFLYALSTLIGMIVGVGIFGIPYCFAQAGILVGFFYLLLIGGAILLIHLLYGEIVLRSDKDSRLVGYAERYLGSRGKKIITGIVIFEFYGALLAYLIAGGHFLNMIFGRFFGGNDFFWLIIFFVLGSLAVLFGLKTVAFSEFFMTLFLLGIAFVIILKGAPRIDFANLSNINLAKFFLPYGVVLFSLTGGAAIPEMRQILRNQGQKLKKAIILGTAIPVVIYFLFALVIVGVTGSKTTENAIDGLVPFFGQWMAVLGAIFGFLAVMTSFLILGLNLRKIFQYDYKLNKFISWGLVCFVPLIAFLFGLNNFILIIGLVGAIAGGLDGIMIVLIYKKAKRLGDRQPEYSLRINRVFIYGLILLFGLGIIYQFIYLAK